MKLRWSELAGQDLEAIHDYIAQDSPDAAAETIEKIVSTAEQLEQYPKLGQRGRIKNTRELICAPYVIFYSIERDVVEILNVFHSSRRYPAQ